MLNEKNQTVATYSIRDLEKISGIKAHTLRVWEQRYSVLQPKRTKTNIRFYDEDDLRLLLSISMLNNNGIKISKIAKMDPTEVHERCQELFEASEEFETQINAMTLSMIDMDEFRFEKIISNNAVRYGFEETMIKVITPFFERVGILWQTGTIRPAQEHFISNLVRQKVIVAIDAQLVPNGPEVPKYLLFLPEYETHELSLLFASYLLRSRGNRVIYLGVSLPEEDLDSVYETYHPDYIFTILTMNPPKETSIEFLDRLGKKFNDSIILASGHSIMEATPESENVTILRSMTELLPIATRKEA